MKTITAIAFVCTAFLFVSCDQSNNPTISGGTGQTSLTYTYTVSGNTLIFSSPQIITMRAMCLNNTLVSRPDTNEASIDTSTFTLNASGDTLVINKEMVLTRIGGGTSIEGTWSAATDGISVTIGPATITVTITPDFAADFVENWNRRPPADKVTVTRISPNLVTLNGTATGEVVTILFSGSGDMTYSSSGKATTTVYKIPVACPNDEPDWYDAFLTANRTPGKIKEAVVVANPENPQWLKALQ